MGLITFSELEKANASIRTTQISGKDYAEVNQRIKAFRMVYPAGTIETQMLSNEGGVCIFRATVRDGINILATGTAYEKEGSSFINKTSYIENCETSAVGRALGMAGFGIDTSVASAEEVQTAILNQTKEPETVCSDCGKPIKAVKTKYGEVFTAESIVDHTTGMYGKPLCFPCAQEAKKRGEFAALKAERAK